MLELKSISWKNFLSYGDYISSLDLDDLGQCLIVGEILDDDKSLNKSNGAGKSSIPSVIQWVLFGRTMHVKSPGNNIVNHYTGKDCWAKLTFKNGDSIIRTRNTEGKNELIYYKDGNEERMVSDTLSTSANQQAKLNKIFNLDWEIFCGSVFFNQYGKPWMEMTDNVRKKAIERTLHVDRLTYYAQAAKSKCDSLDLGVERLRMKVTQSESEIDRIKSEIERVQLSSNSFNDNKLSRISKVKEQAEQIQSQIDSVALPDLESIRQKWDLISKVNEKIDLLKKQRDIKRSKLAEVVGTSNSLKQRINNWEKKAGGTCSQCEQSINIEHINDKTEPLQAELGRIDKDLEEINDAIKEYTDQISKAETMLEERTPSITIREAKSIHDNIKRLQESYINLNKQIDDIKNEEDPHKITLIELNEKLTDTTNAIQSKKEELERSELLNKHYNYVYKAYNDRQKIKSFIFREHVPFINARLRHYLDVFNLDIKIELTDSLGISSNLWGYDFESGGERKRTDVAFMLAMFDFHEQMYGRQCNILVLDEVDGRMDDDGIDALINIIKNDLSHRVESILMISHRNMMQDMFPKELRVVRRNRFSYIE